MKVALVYTSTTSESIELVEREAGNVPPRETEVASYQDPSILAEVRDADYVTAPSTVRLMGMYMTAVSERAGAILNLCSSVGEVADIAQDIIKYTEISIVRVDEETRWEAMKQGERIGVMAILSATLSPTKSAILRVTREMNRQVELVDVLVDGGFGLDQEQLEGFIGECAGTIADKVDVIFLAQGSTAYYEEYIHEKYGKVVSSNPRSSAAALKDALVKKGLM